MRTWVPDSASTSPPLLLRQVTVPSVSVSTVTGSRFETISNLAAASPDSNSPSSSNSRSRTSSSCAPKHQALWEWIGPAAGECWPRAQAHLPFQQPDRGQQVAFDFAPCLDSARCLPAFVGGRRPRLWARLHQVWRQASAQAWYPAAEPRALAGQPAYGPRAAQAREPAHRLLARRSRVPVHTHPGRSRLPGCRCLHVPRPRHCRAQVIGAVASGDFVHRVATFWPGHSGVEHWAPTGVHDPYLSESLRSTECSDQFRGT